MQVYNMLTRFILLFTLPGLFSPLFGESFDELYPSQRQEWERPKTYSEALRLLHEIEDNEIEEKYSIEDLVKINEYLITLAREGILPGKADRGEELEESIQELLEDQDSVYQLTQYQNTHNKIIPAVLTSSDMSYVTKCSWMKKNWRKTKKFCKEYQTEIIIGVLIVVVVGAVAIAAVSASAATSGAAGVAAGSISSSDAPPKKNQTPALNQEVQDQITTLKLALVESDFESSAPAEQLGRIEAASNAHLFFDELHQKIISSPELAQELQYIDYGVSFPESAKDNPVEYAHSYIDQMFETNFQTTDPSIDYLSLSFQKKGEIAASYGEYDLAITNFQ